MQMLVTYRGLNMIAGVDAATEAQWRVYDRLLAVPWPTVAWTRSPVVLANDVV